jgi:rsbT antagonist protein RsbS
MDRIPILRVRGIVIVSLQIDLSDSLVYQFQEDLLSSLEANPAKGIVIDVSSVRILDTFTSRALAQTAQMAMLMNTPTVISGMSPSIVLTLIEMGFAGMNGFRTTLDLDSAIALLDSTQLQAERR